MKILNRFDDSLIVEDLSDSMLGCVDEAIKARSNLSRSNLSRAEGFNPYRTDALRMLLDQPGKIRAYKLVNQENEGPTNGGLKYIVGKTVSAKADKDENLSCSRGVNLATLPWCMNEYRDGYKVLLCEFTAKDIAAIPHGTDGKFRVHRCKVVKEVDLKVLGLIK